MRTAAKHNLHLTEATPQSLALHFIDAEGADLDLSAYTLMGAVEQEGVFALPCAFTDASNAVVEFPALAAGRAVYDLFLRDGAGKDYPLIRGAIHVLGRITPAEAEGTGGDAPIDEGLEVSMPAPTDGAVTVTDNPSLVTSAQVSAATAAAETASHAATAAEDATTRAEDAATRAEDALEQIPVDAGGNMAIAGGLTVAGVANFNGGASVAGELSVPTEVGSGSAAVNFNLASGVLFNELFSYRLNMGTPGSYGTAATVSALRSNEVYTSSMPQGLYHGYPLTKLFIGGNPAIRAVFLPFFTQQGDQSTVKVCFYVGSGSISRRADVGGVDDWLYYYPSVNGIFACVVEITLCKAETAGVYKARVRTMYRDLTVNKVFVTTTVSEYSSSTIAGNTTIGNGGFIGFIWAQENCYVMNKAARAGVWGVRCDGGLMYMGNSWPIYTDNSAALSNILVATFDDYTGTNTGLSYRIGVPQVYLTNNQDKGSYIYSALSAGQFLPNSRTEVTEVYLEG